MEDDSHQRALPIIENLWDPRARLVNAYRFYDVSRKRIGGTLDLFFDGTNSSTAAKSSIRAGKSNLSQPRAALAMSQQIPQLSSKLLGGMQNKTSERKRLAARHAARFAGKKYEYQPDSHCGIRLSPSPSGTLDLSNQVVETENAYLASEICKSQPVKVIDLTSSEIGKSSLERLVQAVQSNRSIISVISDQVSTHEGCPSISSTLSGLQSAARINLLAHQRQQRRLDVAANRTTALVRRRQNENRILLLEDDEETFRTTIIQERENELIKLLLARHHKVRLRLLKHATRNRRREERRYHISVVSVNETCHRHELIQNWISRWLAITERTETRFRVIHMKSQHDSLAVILDVVQEDRYRARQCERNRLEVERLTREIVESQESDTRKVIEKERELDLLDIRVEDSRGIEIATHKTQMRQDLTTDEWRHRCRTATDESDSFVWLIKQWDIAEQQKLLELERHRQIIVTEETSVREVVITEEHILRPIIEDLVRTCTGMALARELFILASTDRRSTMTTAPILAIKIPGEIKPQKYIMGQHLSASTEEPDTCDAEPCVRFIAELPTDWISKIKDIEQQEQVESTKKKEELEKQRKLHERTQQKLGAMSHADHVQRMIAQSLAASIETTRSDIHRKHQDPMFLKKKKETILGGLLSFKCTTANMSPSALKTEKLISKKESWTVRPEGFSLSKNVTKVLKYPAAGMQEILEPTSELKLYIKKFSSFKEVQEMLRGCRYQNLLDSWNVPIHRTIAVSLQLLFIDAIDEDDLFLTSEENNILPTSLLLVETSAMLSIVLTPPFLWLPPDNRTCTFIEGDSIDKSQLISDIICNDQPIISRFNGVVTCATGTAVSRTGSSSTLGTFEHGTIIIQFDKGYTPDDFIVFKSGQDAFYSESDKTIRVKELPVATIIEGGLCRATTSSATIRNKEDCERIVIHLTSPAVTADVVRKLLLRLRFYNFSLDPVEGPRLLSITLVDQSGSSSTISFTVVVIATDNPTILSIPSQKKFYHFACTATGIPSHLRNFIRYTDYILFPDVTIEDVDTDKFCGGHASVGIVASYQKGDLLSLHNSCFEPSGRQGVKAIPLENLDVLTPEVSFDPDALKNLWEIFYYDVSVGIAAFFDDQVSQHSKDNNLKKRGSIPITVKQSEHIIEREQSEDHLHISMTSGSASPKGLSSKWGLVTNSFAGKASPSDIRDVGDASKYITQLESRIRSIMSIFMNASPAKGGRRFHMQFSLAGTMSIAASQAVIRSLTFTPATRHEYTRSIDLEVQIGKTAGKLDTEGKSNSTAPHLLDPSHFQPVLKGNVSVKVTPPLVTVSGKSVLLKYTEGSGSVRIAPFELSPDTLCDGYENGFIKVQVIEGGCRDDILGVREEGLTIKIRDLYDAELPLSELIAFGNRYEEEKIGKKVKPIITDSNLNIIEVGRKRSISNKKWGENRMLNKEWLNITKSLLGSLIDERNTASSISEIYCDGKYIGILASTRTALQLTFTRAAPTSSQKQLGRKEVGMFMKALTYANTSRDPQELIKIIRVTLSDGSSTFSQSMLEVQVQPVDDVTEIVLRNDKLHYVPCSKDAIIPFLIAPLGEGHIEDPDTESFDGGYLLIEIVGGAAKGDTLGILSLTQQRHQLECLANVALRPTKAFKKRSDKSRGSWAKCLTFGIESPEKYLFDSHDGDKKIVSCDGMFSATVTYPQSKNTRDAHDIRISFPKRSLDPVITRDVVSYLLNCITYTSVMKERLREGMRTIQIRVSDGVNPQDGKIRIQLNVRLPFIHVGSSLPSSATPGTVSQIAPKLVVNHSDSLGFITTGFLQVEVCKGFTSGDTLVLSLKEGGFTLKENVIYLKSQLFGTITVNTSHKVRIEFQSSGKATQKSVVSLLRWVGLKVQPPQSEADSCNRIVLYSGCYGKSERWNEAEVTVYVSTVRTTTTAVAEEEEQTCGCSAGRDSAKISDQKKPVTEIRVRETVAEDTSIQYKNLTENACSGDRNYEGYVVGCIYSYSDKYTGRTDCGEQKISGGTFRMGSENYGESGLGKHDIERRYRDNSIHGINRGDAEDPIRQVDVKTFYIDRCEVTNQQFLDFVEARGYVSDAELYNWSFVMEPFIKPELLASDPGRVEGAKWWRAIEGASWKHPEGPGSSIYSLPTWYGKPTPGIPNTPAGDRLSHPVSHISWRDAYNFCRWRGKRLPTEAEYEYALRGGLDQKIFAWGDELYPEGKHLMNVWQGDFSAFENTAEDGSRGTNKVASYPPNGFGVYDLTGNIWEWVYDDFVTGTRQSVAEREETHGSSSTSARVSHKAKRGGSHMCHASTCNRYRSSARSGIESDSSTANLGFRCGRDYEE